MDERGFTLIELMIVTVIVPIIIGALSVSLISIFSLQSSVSNRLGDSANSQVVTTNFTSDVQRAAWITTSPILSQCGTGTQLLAIQLGSLGAVGTGDFVSYNAVLQSNSLYSLVRDKCAASATATTPPGTPGSLLSSTTVAYDLNQPCSIGSVLNCLQVQAFSVPPNSPPVTPFLWTPTNGITSVQFNVYANKSKYSYAVAAEPLGVDSSSTSSLGTIAKGDSCQFALPGTGTYASQLCFFDFANVFSGGSLPNNKKFQEYVPGGYVLSGYLTISGDPHVVAAKFPTYSDAFLGNANAAGQPFYSGVGCPVNTPATYVQNPQNYKPNENTCCPAPAPPTNVQNGVTYGTPSCISPAIYQQNSGGTDRIMLTNITLLTASGTPVSGYEIVTADAETTDPGESITWTSNLNFTQIPNSPGTSAPAANVVGNQNLEGNACATSKDGKIYDGGGITDGSGHVLASPVSNVPQVKCTSNIQATTPRTGTLMLGVTPPLSGDGKNGNKNGKTCSGVGTNGNTCITAVIKGAGLEGVSFGLLLP